MNVSQGGTITMAGGEISGNTATVGEIGLGGGMSVLKGGTFTMIEGAITGNSANGSRGSEGGGVAVDSGTFTMEGGTIYGKANSLPAGTDASLANNAQSGASVYLDDATAK
jgi:hypothetical protein